jgi:hypothetical protein
MTESKKQKKNHEQGVKTEQQPMEQGKIAPLKLPAKSKQAPKNTAAPLKDAAVKQPASRGRGRRYNDNTWRFKDPAFDLDEPQGFKYTAKTLADWNNPDNYNAIAAKSIHRQESTPADHTRKPTSEQTAAAPKGDVQKSTYKKKRKPPMFKKPRGERTPKL